MMVDMIWCFELVAILFAVEELLHLGSHDVVAADGKGECAASQVRHRSFADIEEKDSRTRNWPLGYTNSPTDRFQGGSIMPAFFYFDSFPSTPSFCLDILTLAPNRA